MPQAGLSHGRWAALACCGVLAALVAVGCGSSCCCCSSDPGGAAACLTNAKSLGLAVVMYTQDWDEWYPTPKVSWADALLPYVRSERGLRCPTVSAKNPNQYGYAFNSTVAGKSAIQVDARNTILVYDSTTLTRGATDAVTTLPHPGRHSGLNSVVYADGYGISVAP